MTEESSIRFAADVMLGSLAKWLRILGYNTFYSNNANDNQLLEIIWRENRILLSRDLQLVNGVHPNQRLLITSKILPYQVAQVVGFFNLKAGIRLFSICSDCNVHVIPIDKSNIESLVPPFVFHKYDQFQTCPKCGQVFWPGTHRDLAIEWLAKQGIVNLESGSHEK